MILAYFDVDIYRYLIICDKKSLSSPFFLIYSFYEILMILMSILLLLVLL